MPSKASSKQEPRAALGVRAHSGWAALVVLADHDGKLELVDRRRIELTDATVRGFPQPYHAAESLALDPAAKLVGDCIESARVMAEKSLAWEIQDLRGQGYDVQSCGVLAGSGRPLPDLAKILTSHALLHTAEGELFRDALRFGAGWNGLRIESLRERTAWEDAARALDCSVHKLQAEISGMGRKHGPPWSLDQKLAALAARVALRTQVASATT